MRRQFQGIVQKNSTPKTLVVAVSRVVIHPIYRKRFRRQKRYHVHAEEQQSYAVGSTVRFQECRPMSKTKRWRIVPEGKRSEVSPRV